MGRKKLIPDKTGIQELDDFINFLALQDYSNHTIRQYKRHLIDFLEFVGTRPIDEHTLTEYIAYLKNKRNSTSILKYLYAIKSFCKYYNLPINWSRVPLPKARSTFNPKALHPEEIERIINAAPNLKFRVMLRLGYEAALRAGELVKVRVTWWDGEYLRIPSPEKSGVPTEIPLSDKLNREIKEYTESDEYIPTKPMWMFVNERKHPYDPSFFAHKIFRPIAESAGYTNLRYHEFARDSRCTNILREHGDLYLANRILRHRSLQTTLRYARFVGVDIKKKLYPGGG